MVETAIKAIIFGVILMVLGTMPSLLAALIDGLQIFASILSGLPGRRADLPASAGQALVVCGGVMVIAGLVALVA